MWCGVVWFGRDGFLGERGIQRTIRMVYFRLDGLVVCEQNDMGIGRDCNLNQSCQVRPTYSVVRNP